MNDDPEGRPMVEIRFPEAPAEDYLQWMAFWREVETAMLERPPLEVLASAQSAPFLHGEVARGLSDVVHEITVQARAALALGRGCAPVVSLAQPVVAQMLRYMVLRGQWLKDNAASLPIEPMPPQVVALRETFMATLRAGIALHSS